MKFLILLTIVAVAVAQDTYDSTHDDLDIDAVVSNDDTLKAFNDCFLDAGPCDPIMQHFKNDLPEAIELACSKCNDAQKNIMNTFLTGLQRKMPEGFELLKKKYDPEDKYFAALAAGANKA